MYATLSQLKEYLSISSSSDDALLTELLERATAIIDQLTHTRFRVTADETKRFSVDDVERRHGYDIFEVLWLPPRLYLAALPTAIVAGTGAILPPTALIPPRSDPPYAALMLRPGFTFAAHAGEVQVTGRWGWSVTPPADITHACIRLAAYAYQQRASQSDVDRPVVADGGLVVLPTKLPADVRALLTRYAPIL